MQPAQLDPQVNQQDDPTTNTNVSGLPPFQSPPTALNRDVHPQPTQNLFHQDNALFPPVLSQTQDDPPQQATPQISSDLPLRPQEEAPSVPPAVGAFNKEAGVFGSESVPLVELSEAEIAPETEGWIEKVPKPESVTLEQPVIHEDEVLVAEPSTTVIDEKLVLPMTQAAVQVGITKKVTESARWLAEWCVRIVKMMGGKAAYQPEPMHQGYEKGTNQEPN